MKRHLVGGCTVPQHTASQVTKKRRSFKIKFEVNSFIAHSNLKNVCAYHTVIFHGSRVSVHLDGHRITGSRCIRICTG